MKLVMMIPSKAFSLYKFDGIVVVAPNDDDVAP
jgi:hypothetical protein